MHCPESWFCYSRWHQAKHACRVWLHFKFDRLCASRHMEEGHYGATTIDMPRMATFRVAPPMYRSGNTAYWAVQCCCHLGKTWIKTWVEKVKTLVKSGFKGRTKINPRVAFSRSHFTRILFWGKNASIYLHF